MLKPLSQKSIAVALLATLGLTTMAQAEDKPTIKISEANWPASAVIGQVMKQVIEKKLGFKAEIINGDEVVMIEALIKGDGTVDIIPDFWPPYFPGQWKAYIAEGSTKQALLNDKPYLGTEGLYVPAYVAEKLGVTSIEQLKDPKIAKLFDSDGDSKGDYWVGAPGWQNIEQLAVKARDQGYDKLWTPLVLEVPVFEATLAEAIRQEKPILFYSYIPEWIHSAFKLTRLKDQPFNGYASDTWKGTPVYNADGCFKYVASSENADWFNLSKITCENNSTNVSVVRSATLSKRAAAVDTFARQINFTVDQVNGFIIQVSRDKKPAADVAAEWIAANDKFISENWLAGVDMVK